MAQISIVLGDLEKVLHLHLSKLAYRLSIPAVYWKGAPPRTGSSSVARGVGYCNEKPYWVMEGVKMEEMEARQMLKT